MYSSFCNCGLYRGTNNTGSGVLVSGLESPHFSPYITTVGLFDEHKKLVMVGKLSQPIKKSKKLPFTIKMIHDY